MPTAGWVVTSAPLYDEMGRLLDKRLHVSLITKSVPPLGVWFIPNGAHLAVVKKSYGYFGTHRLNCDSFDCCDYFDGVAGISLNFLLVRRLKFKLISPKFISRPISRL